MWTLSARGVLDALRVSTPRLHKTRVRARILPIQHCSRAFGVGLGSPETEKAIVEAAREKQTGVSLRMLLSFGQAIQTHDLPRGLLTSAQFLKRELSIRFAHRIVELDRLPRGLSAMPSVRTVRDWYRLSFEEIRAFPALVEGPGDTASEAAFADLLRTIFERHGPTVVTMARGIFEFRRSLGVRHGQPLPAGVENGIHQYLDHFFTSRVGIRTLIGQQTAMHEPPVPGYVGIVDTKCSPRRVVSAAIDDARLMCERTLGDSPEVHIHGSSDSFVFPYVPSYMRHVLFELLKNSMRAVVERHRDAAGGLPPIRVIISAGSASEDVVIKISDEGGGIPRSGMARIFSYFYTTAPPQFDEDDDDDDRDTVSVGASPAYSVGQGEAQRRRAPDFSTALPMSGLGVGLPLSRVFAKYFGGDLQIISMEGYGTDAFIYLRRLGDAAEPLSEGLYSLQGASGGSSSGGFPWGGGGGVFFEQPRNSRPPEV